MPGGGACPETMYEATLLWPSAPAITQPIITNIAEPIATSEFVLSRCALPPLAFEADNPAEDEGNE
jgi:hypothetical protein